MSDLDALASYGMENVATVEMIGDDRFKVTLTKPEAALWEKSIYAIVLDDVIVRIGSSKGLLGLRLKSWDQGVTHRLRHPYGKSSTPGWEAEEWRTRLLASGGGYYYARRGTLVTTPIGTFPVYMDEESVLLGRHRPVLNRNFHR